MGEASPFAPITGDTQSSCFETAQVLARLIKGKNPLNIDTLMNEINRAMVGEFSIRSAFDMALYDLLGKYLNQPLYRIFGGDNHEIHTDLTVGLQDTVEETQKFAICADESVFDHHDAFKLTAAGAVDYLNIKLGKSGGLHTALKIDAAAQAAGCKCMIGCFGESRLGLSAAAPSGCCPLQYHFS